jgi:hypothetical protein
MHRLQTKPINNAGRIALFNFRPSLQNVSPPLQSLLALTSLFQVCRQEKIYLEGALFIPTPQRGMSAY